MRRLLKTKKQTEKQTSAKSVFILVASITALASSAAIAAGLSGPTPQAKLIADSNAKDPAAKQITRKVANESLRTISTKDSDSGETESVAVESLEETGPVLLPPKIVSQPAPGTRVEIREPAAEAAPGAPSEESKEIPAAAPAEASAAPAEASKVAPAHHDKVVDSVAPEKALLWLQNGNKRYLKKANRADGKSQADRDRLSKGQHPHAIVLSCSDSRVPPETVFDQSLGEIFVVRTAGESLDSSVIASLEYAVEHLGPRLLVVMGHTSCGAVNAAIATKDGESAGSPALDSLVADIKPRLPSRGPAGVSSQSVEIESAANAQGVAADLMTRSKIIRERVEKGDLKIKPSLYYLDSGVVKFY